MMLEKDTHRLSAGLGAIALLALITAVAKTGVGLNATSVALLYLMVVLATSALAGLVCGMVLAVASGLLVNYYFLPPFGTLYIEAPEDWVAFAAYTVTALVVSHFAATVRRHAAEAERRRDQLARLARFAEAFAALRNEDLTPENLTQELRRAYELDYCAVYPLGGNGTAGPVFSGIWPARAAEIGSLSPNPPHTILEVVAEEGADVRCLDLKDNGKTVGALVLSRISLLPEVAQALAAIAALVVRQRTAVRPPG